MNLKELVTISGETKTIEEWMLQSGIKKSTLYMRLAAGWKIERALTDPLHSQYRRSPMIIEVNGIKKTLSEWSAETGISEKTIRSRINSGWMPEQAVGEPIVKNRRSSGNNPDDIIDAAFVSKLRKALSNIHRDTLSINDLLNDAIVAIKTRMAKDRYFFRQKEAYIIQWGVWAAQHTSRDDRVYHSNIQSLEALTETDTRNDSDHDYEDCELAIQDYTSDGDTVEEQVERRMIAEDLVEVVKRLSPSNRAIVRMITLGYDESEIAEELRISRPAVSQRKATIRQSLSRFNPNTQEAL